MAQRVPGQPAAPLLLASGSPRRRELLGHLGLPFEVEPTDIEEVSVQTDPAAIAADLARQKAAEAARRWPGRLVLAADTLVALDGQVLGKPRDRAENLAFLRRLSGQTHTVYTGVCLQRDQQHWSGTEATQVTMRPLSEAELAHYADSGEGLDKAGGYGIQGLGMALVSSVAGDYSAVVGLPLTLVIRLLRMAGVPVWGEPARARP